MSTKPYYFDWDNGVRVMIDRKTGKKTSVNDIVRNAERAGKLVTMEQAIANETKKSADFEVFKADEDKRLVFGWASIVITVNGEELEDRQHDIIDPEDLEDAAYEYVLNFRDTGEEHLPGYRKKGKLVESVVLTKEKQKAMGIPDGVIPVGWWIGFKIDDEDTWQRVKNGTYKMFSIEGKAQREPVEKAQPTGCGVLVIRDGKILTGTRTYTMSGYGQICGPGGHVEEGETPKEAAKREAFEEFGITCNDLQPLGVQDGGRHGTSAVFLCTDYEGVPKTDEEEMTHLQWRTIGEIKDAELFPPFAQSLELLPERKTVAKTFSDVLKFNPYHDSLGRFSSGGSAASFTFQTRDPNKQHWADKAIARLKQQQAQQPAAPPKPAKTYDSKGFADSDDADYHQLYNRKQYYQQQQLTAAQQKAANAYVDPNTEPGSLYNVAQNMNWAMVTGQKLTPKQQKIHDDMMDAMHNVGHNVNLTRYDHAGMVDSMLKQLGAGSDYTKLSPSQLKKALVGQTMGENKMISTTTNDFQNAPAHVQQLFQNRAVKINYKTKAGVQGMLMPIGAGGDQGELVLAPTNGGKNKAPKITDVRFTGKSVYRAYNGRTYPQIEIDVEWD